MDTFPHGVGDSGFCSLSSARHQNEDLEVSMNESFGSFLARLSSQASSRDAFARSVAIESYCGAQDDGPETMSNKHILTMCLKHSSRFEIGRANNNRVSYVKHPGSKHPGSLSLVPAGMCPGIRAETNFDLVVCALDSEW
jgi:hypothetical protein